jgi:hypothetical protein
MDIKTKKKGLVIAAAWPIAFALLSYLYYRLFHLWPHNSDDANSLLLGYDIFNGNPLLRNWYSPPDSFFATDVLQLGLLATIFGPSARVMLILPAMLWAAIVLPTMAVTMRFARNRAFAFLTVAGLLAFPVVSVNSSMELITRAPMHIATTLYGLVLLLLAYRWLRAVEFKAWVLPAYTLLLAATVYSDPLILFIAALPVLLVCAHWYRINSLRTISLAALTIAGVAIGKIALMTTAAAGGFTAPPQPMIFAPFDRWPSNFGLTLRGLMALFGADFTDRQLTPVAGETVFMYLSQTPLVMLARLPFLGMVGVAVWKTGRRIARADSPIELLLFYPIVIILAACLLSGQMQDFTSARYLFPVLIFGVILMTIYAPANRWLVRFAGATLAVSLVSFSATYVRALDAPSFATPAQNHLADWLSANGLTDGYAPYWSASILTVLSDGKVRARAITATDDSDGYVQPQKWLSKYIWYAKPVSGRRFVVYDSRPLAFNYERSRVIHTLGEPRSSHWIGPYEVLEYDVDKTDFSRLSLP